MAVSSHVCPCEDATPACDRRSDAAASTTHFSYPRLVNSGRAPCPLEVRARLRNHRLHYQTSRAGIDHAERAQRKQREHLNPGADLTRIVGYGRRARAAKVAIAAANADSGPGAAFAALSSAAISRSASAATSAATSSVLHGK